MATNVRLQLGLLQIGDGVPTHISPKCTLFYDLDAEVLYINKDGFSNWDYFIDSDTDNVVFSSITATTITATTYYNIPSNNKCFTLTGGTSFVFTDFQLINSLSINKDIGSVTNVILNQLPKINDFYIVTDERGDSYLNPITISGGTFTINGNQTITIKLKNNPSLTFLFNGIEYTIV